MPRVGRLIDFVGGSIGRMTGTGLATGLFLILFGVTPAEFVVWLFNNPPSFLSNELFKFAVFVIGIVVIAFSLTFNVWSKKQKAIDGLAEDLSWAIHHLLNRDPRPSSDPEVAQWEADYTAWCARVSAKLENRAFFTRADQLHFDRLGFVNQVVMSEHPRFNWLLSQLNLKFDRLREVINWSQVRRH